MKALVIGGGGREHAICEALRRSKRVTKIYAAPGNAGIAQIAECVPLKDTDTESLLRFALENSIDLTVVGPEASLAAGVVDLFQENGLKILGPTKLATQIEASKEFAKDLMRKYGVPTADYAVFEQYDEALHYVEQKGAPIVIKYDGLAAGKGVVVAMELAEARQALQDMLLDKKYGDARVVVEEFLEGQEFSFMCFVNGNMVLPMQVAQDHKRAFDGDKGPNTGGMGAYSPVPFVEQADYDFALENIMKRTASALKSEGCDFCGILYGGLIKTAKGIKVIEFNARFGDPETEVVLPRLKSDFYEVCLSVIQGEPVALEWDTRSAIGVVMASKGYPDAYDKDIEIKGLENVSDVEVYHMGTKKDGDRLLTNGGRVMLLTAMADTLDEAREKAMREIQKIHCDNLFYRKDIGYQAVDK